LARAEEIAHEVNLQRAVEIPQFEIADKGCFGYSCAVYQQVGTAKNLVHAAGQRHYALLAGGISTKSVGHAFTQFGVDGVRHACGFFTLNIHYRHAVTLCSKPTAEELA